MRNIYVPIPVPRCNGSSECDEQAVALAPQHRGKEVLYVLVCEAHLDGWTDPTEPQYGITRYPAFYLDGARVVPSNVMLGVLE